MGRKKYFLKGVVDPISLIGIGFLLITLTVAVSVTNNPLKTFIMDSFAKGSCDDYGSAAKRNSCKEKAKEIQEKKAEAAQNVATAQEKRADLKEAQFLTGNNTATGVNNLPPEPIEKTVVLDRTKQKEYLEEKMTSTARGETPAVVPETSTTITPVKTVDEPAKTAYSRDESERIRDNSTPTEQASNANVTENDLAVATQLSQTYEAPVSPTYNFSTAADNNPFGSQTNTEYKDLFKNDSVAITESLYGNIGLNNSAEVVNTNSQVDPNEIADSKNIFQKIIDFTPYGIYQDAKRDTYTYRGDTAPSIAKTFVDKALSKYTFNDTWEKYLDAYKSKTLTQQEKDIAVNKCVESGGHTYSCMKEVNRLSNYSSNEQIASSVNLGVDITNKIAIAVAPYQVLTTKSAGALVGTGFKILGGVTTLDQGGRTVDTCITNPDSPECKKEKWYLGLSAANMLTGDMLMAGVKIAPALNTIVTGANMATDVDEISTGCFGAEKSISGCAMSAGALIADIGFARLDFNQGELLKFTKDIPSTHVNAPQIDVPEVTTSRFDVGNTPIVDVEPVRPVISEELDDVADAIADVPTSTVDAPDTTTPANRTLKDRIVKILEPVSNRFIRDEINEADVPANTFTGSLVALRDKFFGRAPEDLPALSVIDQMPAKNPDFDNPSIADPTIDRMPTRNTNIDEPSFNVKDGKMGFTKEQFDALPEANPTAKKIADYLLDRNINLSFPDVTIRKVWNDFVDRINPFNIAPDLNRLAGTEVPLVPRVEVDQNLPKADAPVAKVDPENPETVRVTNDTASPTQPTRATTLAGNLMEGFDNIWNNLANTWNTRIINGPIGDIIFGKPVIEEKVFDIKEPNYVHIAKEYQTNKYNLDGRDAEFSFNENFSEITLPNGEKVKPDNYFNIDGKVYIFKMEGTGLIDGIDLYEYKDYQPSALAKLGDQVKVLMNDIPTNIRGLNPINSAIIVPTTFEKNLSNFVEQINVSPSKMTLDMATRPNTGGWYNTKIIVYGTLGAATFIKGVDYVGEQYFGLDIVNFDNIPLYNNLSTAYESINSFFTTPSVNNLRKSGKIISDIASFENLKKIITSTINDAPPPPPTEVAPIENSVVENEELSKIDVYSQRDNPNLIINEWGTTMLELGCTPSSAINAMTLLEYELTDKQKQEIIDNLYWNPTKRETGPEAVLMSLRKYANLTDAVSYGQKNRIVDAKIINNYTGVLVYGGTVTSPTEKLAHTTVFTCNKGNCYVTDSYFNNSKPTKCNIQSSNSIKCGDVDYHVGTGGGYPDALFPVINSSAAIIPSPN